MSDTEFFDLLLGVMYETRKNKRYGRDSIAFEANWAPLLIRMMNELKDRSFRVLHNYAFLTSVPKWREIFATEFSGRIADHLLCDILKPYIEAELHPRTFNNRENMGSQAAINQVIEDIYEASQGYTQVAWIIKWDLKGFFPNAICSCMEQCFNAIIDKNSESLASRYGGEFPSFMKWLSMVTIHCNPTQHCELRTPSRFWKDYISQEKSLFGKPDGIGVPIGRMSSQTGMGLYINDEVRWLNDECGIKTTVFMDDGVCIVPDRQKAYALSVLPELRKRLSGKGVRVNPKKYYCQQYWKGLEFLGTHIRPYRLILNDCTWNRCLVRIDEFNSLADKYSNIDRLLSAVNSYTGLLKNRTSYNRIMEIKDRLDEEWWQWIEWDSRRQCIVSKPEHAFRRRLQKKYHLKLKKL